MNRYIAHNVKHGSAGVKACLRLLSGLSRTVVLTVLVLLEPVVTFICTMGMLLGVAVSSMFEVSAAGSRFPFLWMVALSLALGITALLYHALLVLLLKDRLSASDS